MQEFSDTKNIKYRRFGITTVMLVALASGMSGANAATVTGSFNLRGSGGSQDHPNFVLSNTSDAGVEITRFFMTIGDDAYNFDRFYTVGSGAGIPTTPAGGNSPTFNLGTGNGGADFDEIDINYDGFAADTESKFQVEFDPDGGEAIVNPRFVLFNNGLSVPNSKITVSFLFNGIPLDAIYDIPENPSEGVAANIYNFAASVDYQVSAVPLPASLPLFGAGLAILGLASWRRKKKTSA